MLFLRLLVAIIDRYVLVHRTCTQWFRDIQIIYTRLLINISRNHVIQQQFCDIMLPYVVRCMYAARCCSYSLPQYHNSLRFEDVVLIRWYDDIIRWMGLGARRTEDGGVECEGSDTLATSHHLTLWSSSVSCWHIHFSSYYLISASRSPSSQTVAVAAAQSSNHRSSYFSVLYVRNLLSNGLSVYDSTYFRAVIS